VYAGEHWVCPQTNFGGGRHIPGRTSGPPTAANLNWKCDSFERTVKMQNNTTEIKWESAIEFSKIPDNNILEIMKKANALRKQYKQNTVFTCGIINAKSGFCSQDCAFCAQSIHHQTNAKTYPLFDKQTIIDQALKFEDHGTSHFSIVTSGFMLNSQEMDTICNAIIEIRKRTNISICTSLGTISSKMAHQLKQSGVTNYHHNLETAQSYFRQICTTHDYHDDIETIHMAKSAGLSVCCGGIMGLGESWEQRIELAFLLRELKVDSIPINFLNPIPSTKLENQALLSSSTALKCIALFRLIHPEKDIVVCGGREITLKKDQSRLFFAGANGLMIGDYLTTPGQQIETDLKMIHDLGLHIK
jgi:biotin synthase